MRCSLCPSNSGVDCRPVPSVGPPQSTCLFLGAGPAKTEAQTGIPYSGLAGDEVNGLYLPLAGLRREDIRIGNASLCWDGTDRTPPESRVLACAREHLPGLLNEVQPEFIIVAGGVTQAIVDMKVRLDMHHGIPQWTSLLDGTWTGWVIPSYEPALGMRETSKMSQIMDDFRRIGQWLEGTWTQPTPDEREKDYRLVETTHELLEYLDADLPTADLFFQPAVDAEKHGPKPWSVQLSRAAHTGRMILAGNTAALRILGDWLASRCITLHNANGDLDVLEALGIIIAEFMTLGHDTMQEAFQLCSLPQGLKPLAYRLIGAVMRSWEDVVWPASVEAILAWIAQGMQIAQTSLTETIAHPLVRGRCVQCGHQHTRGPCKHDGCTSTEVTFVRYELKPGAVEKIFKHVYSHTDAGKEKEKPYQPWKAMAKMREKGLRGSLPEAWEWQAIEAAVGPMPILGIGNAKLEDAIAYAVSDADHTGQVAEVLKESRADRRWQVDERDWDK